MQFAFFAHALGIVLTIYSGSYLGLLLSTLLIGLGNGCTEAACNPMIADAYEGNQMSKMLKMMEGGAGKKMMQMMGQMPR